MAVSKVILNGTTLIDLTADTVASANLLNGITATARNGVGVTGNIPTKTSSNLSASGSIVTAPSGYYAAAATKAVDAGSVTIADTSIGLGRNKGLSLTVQADGYVVAAVSSAQEISPTITSGYVSNGTSGIITITGSIGAQIQTQSSKTVTPTESTQTAVSSGVYTTGIVKVAAIPSDYIGSAIASVEVIEGVTTVSGTTATRGQAIWSAGVIPSGSIPAATFANSSSAQTQYVDISATTEAPVLVSGGYLYINKGYTDDLKISLAKLVPDGASADLASGVILSGYAAYDNDGNLVAGNIPTKSLSNVTASGSVVTVPSGYYATEISKAVDAGAAWTSTSITINPTISVSSSGLITAAKTIGWQSYIISKSGYIETQPFHATISGSSTYQLDTVAASIYTPSSTTQTIPSGVYLTGTQTIAAIPNASGVSF